MSPYASNLRQSATNFTGNYSSSPRSRSAGRKAVARVIRASGFTRLSSARLGLASFWDLGVLDRLQSPLTHYHE